MQKLCSQPVPPCGRAVGTSSEPGVPGEEQWVVCRGDVSCAQLEGCMDPWQEEGLGHASLALTLVWELVTAVCSVVVVWYIHK